MIKLRTLVRKSTYDFGIYGEKTVQEILDLPYMEGIFQIIWTYFTVSNITFVAEILNELPKDMPRINKPGIDVKSLVSWAKKWEGDHGLKKTSFRSLHDELHMAIDNNDNIVYWCEAISMKKLAHISTASDWQYSLPPKNLQAINFGRARVPSPALKMP